MLPLKQLFSPNAKVRFTQERLAILTPRDRKSLEGRIGDVQGYWNFTKKPIVFFPQDGARGQLRLLGVDPQHLELVAEEPSRQDIEPMVAAETDDNRKLSQSELDNLFG